MIRDPVKYLQAYIKSHYKGFREVEVHPHERGAYADCTVMIQRSPYVIRLLLPKEAPTKMAHPLLASVRREGELLWSYKRDYQEFTAWNELLIRIHLHQFRQALFQVHVREGDPDVVERVSRLTDSSLNVELEAVLKDRIARLWSYKPKFSREEKMALGRLTP